MGAAVRRVAHETAPVRPRLRAVTGTRHARRARRRPFAAPAAFRVGMVCLVLMTGAGMLRVSLAASAAEAAIDAWDVRAEIKAAEQVTRSLTADKSSLAASSRIELLACETLNMSRPEDVCYLELPTTDGEDGTADHPPGAADAPAPASGEGDPRVLLGTLMDLAAGEAQMLLVGNMGLGTVR